MSERPLRKRPRRRPHISSFLYRNEACHKFYNNRGFLPIQNEGDGSIAVDYRRVHLARGDGAEGAV